MKKKGTLKLLSCLFGLFMTAGIAANAVSTNATPVNAEDVNNGGTRWFTALGDGELKTYNNPPEGQTQKGFWAEYTPAQGEDSVEIFYNATIKEYAGENYAYVVSSGSAKAVVMTYTQYQYGWEGAAGTTVSLIYMKRPDGKTYATVSLTPELEFDYENGYAYLAGTNQKTVGFDGTTHSETGTVCEDTMSPFTGKKYIKYKMLNHSTKGPLIGIGNYGGTHVAYFTGSDTLETDFLEKATENLPEDSKYRDIYAKMTPELAAGLFSTATSGTYRRARQKQSLAFYGMDTTDTISYCYTMVGGTNYQVDDAYISSMTGDDGGPINIQKTKTLEVGTTYTFNDLAIRATSIRYSTITSATSATVALDGNDYSKSDYYWGVYTSESSVTTTTKTGSDYASSDTSSNVLGGNDTNWSFTPTADDVGKTYYLLVNSTKYPNVSYSRGGGNADLFLFTVPEISYMNADGEEVKDAIGTNADGSVVLGEPTVVPAGKAFIGWKKQTEGIYANRLYSANSVVVPTQNETYVAQYANFTRLAGAEIRLANPNGIRWVAEFDKAEFDALAGSGLNYSYGAIITSESADGVVSDKSINIVGDKDKVIVGDDVYTMYFALADIMEENYTRKYFVAPYVTFTYFDGSSMTVTAGLEESAEYEYSTYKGVVNAIYNDVVAEKNEELGYVYKVTVNGETKYTQLNPTLWANLVDVYNAVNA